MRFKLILEAVSGNRIPVNYQYPLSAAIYKVLASGDAGYAEWLHQQGYVADTFNYKLFCFSRLQKTKGFDDNVTAYSVSIAPYWN